MAKTVRDLMNPELFTLRDTMRNDDALDALLEMGISAAPVVDEKHRPLGVVSLRDLMLGGTKPIVSTPALAIAPTLRVEEAARMMAENELHHLVVVGSDGRVSGLVSSYDLMRALIGLPPKFPATFPHRDAVLDVTWTDTAPFDAEHASAAPPAAGVLVLSLGGSGQREADVWVEESGSLRARITDLLELPHRDEPALARWLTRRNLRFRCAAVAEPHRRARVVERLRERINRAPYPDAVPVES